MSATTSTTNEPSVSTKNTNPVFSDYTNLAENSPTPAQQEKARKATLAIGNQTTVGKPDDDARNKFYDKLDAHNRDNYWKNREDSSISVSADYQFKRKTVHAFSQQLSLSQLQRQLALNRLLEIDLRRFGERTEVVTFCVCAIVLNDDAEGYFGNKKPYHPAQSAENNHSEFSRLESRLIERWGPITKRRIQSVYGKILQGNPPKRENVHPRLSAFGNSETQARPSFSPDWAVSQSGTPPI